MKIHKLEPIDAIMGIKGTESAGQNTAFLLELDSNKIFRKIKSKLDNHAPLSDEEIMQLIILPLPYRKKEDKENKIHETVELATKIKEGD